MQHRVTTVAEHRFLDRDIALKVAETSRNAYPSHGEYWVSTMTVDAFVKEVKTAQGDDTDAIRGREIAKMQARQN